MHTNRSILTIGNFDGVHAGHQSLLGAAQKMATALGADRGVVVLSFDPHPLSVLCPSRTPTRLMSFASRTDLLRKAGATEVHRLSPTGELLGMSPEAFIAWVVEEFHPIGWIEGPDFRFGKNRAGTLETLQNSAAGLPEHARFEVKTVPPLAVALADNTVVTASSTIIRWLIERGRVRDVWSVLGRPYQLTGTVMPGDRRGRTLNFPTANLGPTTHNDQLDPIPMLPADGVYAALATMPDGSQLAAALSVGTKPQFQSDTQTRTAEAFMLDIQAAPGTSNIPGLPEYGWPLQLDLVGWVRSQMKFDSVERLLEQMTRDCQRIRRIIKHLTPTSTPTSTPA